MWICDIYIYEPSTDIQEIMKKERVNLLPARAMLLSVLYELVAMESLCQNFHLKKIAYFFNVLELKKL